jgi:hypothetical protein
MAGGKKRREAMFSQALRSVVLATTLLALSAFGQTARSMQFRIPFDFKAAGQEWVAGNYEVTARVATPTVRIRNLDSQSAATVVTRAAQSGKSSDKSLLVFHKYGDTYFLNRLWLSNTYAGRELPSSLVDRELIRNVELASTTTIATIGRSR